MTSTIKTGALIGCGFFSSNHLHAWAEIPDVEIVAVCDLDPEKAEAIAKSFDVKNTFTDASAMLKAMNLDFVDIATTPPSHRSLVELASKHNCAVICQKPFADNMLDARAMVGSATSANVPLIIHENFRWQRGFIRMMEIIDARQIGKPHFARFSFRHGYDNYQNQPYLAELERFCIMDVGLHLFDLAQHFLGEVAYLTCTTQKLNPIVTGEDAFTAMLSHVNGATSVIDSSFYSKIDPDPFPQTSTWIEGDKGTLELSADFELTHHAQNGSTCINIEPDVPNWGEKPWHNIQDSVTRFQRHCVDVLNGKTFPLPSGADNLKTLALALAAYDSARLHKTIAMADWEEGKL